MSEKIQITSPEDEKRLAENVGKYEGLEREYIDAMRKAENSESAIKDCAKQIISTVIHEWNHPISELHEGRFTINAWRIEMEQNFPTLYILAVYDNKVKLNITPEVFHQYDGGSEKVKAFLEKFIEYFRKRTNKIPIGLSPYVMAPRER